MSTFPTPSHMKGWAYWLFVDYIDWSVIHLLVLLFLNSVNSATLAVVTQLPDFPTSRRAIDKILFWCKCSKFCVAVVYEWDYCSPSHCHPSGTLASCQKLDWPGVLPQTQTLTWCQQLSTSHHWIEAANTGSPVQARGVTKIFDTFRIALPLKERFFLLKPCKLIFNDHKLNALTYIWHLVSIGLDNAP